MRGRRQEKEEAENLEEEKEGGEIAETLDNLTIETAGNDDEVEAAEDLKAALEIKVAEDGGNEGEEESDVTHRALGDLEFLTQDADPSRTTLVDACNGFNELNRLEMLWTVRHRWTAGPGSSSFAICIGCNFFSASPGIRQI